VVPQLQDEALHAQHDRGAIGFAVADSIGPGDSDANEDTEDAAQHLAENNKGDVRRQKAPRTADKGVQKAAREAAEAAWERHDVHELAAQSQAASAGKPPKIIKSDVVNLFVTWELDKQSGVLLCGQHVSHMSVPDVLAAWVRAMALSSFDSSGLRTFAAVRRASDVVVAAQAPIVESREVPAAQPWTTPAQHLCVHEHVVYAASHFTMPMKRPVQLSEYLHAPTDLTRYGAHPRPLSLCSPFMCGRTLT